MVELRKRPAAPPAAPPPTKKKTAPKPKVKKEEQPAAEMSAAETPAKASGPPKTGETITLDGFGGEIQTDDETTTTLAKLAADSKAGVVLFTYPKASTPGCKRARPWIQRKSILIRSDRHDSSLPLPRRV